LKVADPNGLSTRMFRKLVLGSLRDLRSGRIRLRDRYREFLVGRADDVPAVTLDVHDPAFYRRVVFGGAMGAAESYARGEWSCEDLTSLLRVFVRDLSVGHAGSVVTPRLLEPIARLGHLLRRNTRTGSRRNTRDHYDLGNDFFALFLDDTMTYSCGIFPSADATLGEASIEKLDRVCRKLRLEPHHRVVEIGSGWGSFALHAATRYGCHVTTTTVSREQLEHVSALIRARGLEDRIDVRLSDYRDLHGRFDRLVSIEMIEAVGHAHLETYLATCERLLTDDGLALIQAIVMPDRHHAAYLRHSGWSTWRTSECTTGRRCATGGSASTRARRTSGPAADRSGSCDSGTTTSVTARRASWRSTSERSRCCWPGRERASTPRR
jgi:cyclopropane-fatty-acyl-phospholipid synthase